MQDPITAALSRRFFLMLAILVLASCALAAQGDTAPPNSEVMGPPAPAATDAAVLADLPITPPAPAATPVSTEPAKPAAAESIAIPPATGWADLALPVMKAIGGVGLVLCMIFGGFMLFRKFAPQYVTRRSSERILRLIETLPMGEKRSIVLVQAGARKFLLASTPGQITLLTSLPELGVNVSSDAPEPAGAAAPVSQPNSFRNLYELEKKVAPPRPAARPALTPDIRGKMLELRKALEG